jgi:hypothetical protein
MLILPLLLTTQIRPAEGTPEDGKEIDEKAAPSRLIVGGRVERVVKPDGNQFTVSCYIPGVRSGRATRRLKIDEASLILRRDRDGQYTRVDLADLYRGDALDVFQASVSPVADAEHARLVFWLIVFPNGAERPVPESVMEVQPQAPRREMAGVWAMPGRAFEFKPGRGYEYNWKAAFPPLPSRLIVGGVVIRFRKPKGGLFPVEGFLSNARAGSLSLVFKVDPASLILRQDKNGQFTKVDLDDLYRGDELDTFQACVAPIKDPADQDHRVFWLDVSPRGAERPVPRSMMGMPN